MDKALKFVILDFITIKPYLTLKNLVLIIGLPFIFIFDSGTSAAANGIIMVFATLFISYPFAVGEKNGIDSLYPMLSLQRKSVVLGRYLFAFVFNICAGIISFTYSFAAMTVLHKDFVAFETLSTVLVLFVLFTVIQAFQLPIYFKSGYAKAKMLAYLPFIALTFLVLAAKSIFGDSMLGFIAGAVEWITANTVMAIGIVIIIWIGIMIISCQTSLAFYQKRDF